MTDLDVMDAASWKDVSDLDVMDAASWKRIRELHVMDAGSWKHVVGWIGDIYPDSDQETSGWGSTPLYQKIDEEPASDTDKIVSGDSIGSTDDRDFRVGLSNPSYEPFGGNVVTVYVRARKVEVGSCTVDLTVQLREGPSTVRGSQTWYDIGTGWVTRSFVVTAAAIVNWSLLQLYVKAHQEATGFNEVFTELSYARVKIT